MMICKEILGYDRGVVLQYTPEGKGDLLRTTVVVHVGHNDMRIFPLPTTLQVCGGWNSLSAHVFSYFTFRVRL